MSTGGGTSQVAVTSATRESATPGFEPPDIEHVEQLTVLAREISLFAETVRTKLDQNIHHCPGWQGRHLAHHVAAVYQWIADVVAHSMTAEPALQLRQALYDEDLPRTDSALMARLREQGTRVVSQLQHASPELDCWTIWPAPPARQFWTRRMLYETVIHRADAENAGRHTQQLVGGAQLEAHLAADGVDETLLGFSRRYAHRLHRPKAAVVAWRATDGPWSWWTAFGPHDPESGRGTPPRAADTVVRGTTGELLLLLWSRRTHRGMEVNGDLETLDLWHENAHV